LVKQKSLVSLILHSVLLYLYCMRNKKEGKIECKKCDVGIFIGEGFEAYHTKYRRQFGINGCWDSSKQRMDMKQKRILLCFLQSY
jgi:hypothetical protein